MKIKLTQDEYDKLKHLEERVSSASTKKEAAPYLTQLNFISNSGGYSGPARNILGEVASYAQCAAGKVSDKEHCKVACEAAYIKLTGFLRMRQWAEVLAMSKLDGLSMNIESANQENSALSSQNVSPRER